MGCFFVVVSCHGPQWGGCHGRKVFSPSTVCLVKVKPLSHARLFATPWTVACTKLLRPWDFQGKSTGVGCHFLLQGKKLPFPSTVCLVVGDFLLCGDLKI